MSLIYKKRSFLGGEHAKPPEPQQTGAVVLELDEMWHDLKKTNKLWIWKAFCRDTGELIDDEWQVYSSVIPQDKITW